MAIWQKDQLTATAAATAGANQLCRTAIAARLPAKRAVAVFIGSNHAWGMDLNDLSCQNDFRVLYHPHIDTDPEHQQPPPSGVPFVQPPDPKGGWPWFKALFFPCGERMPYQ